MPNQEDIYSPLAAGFLFAILLKIGYDAESSCPAAPMSCGAPKMELHEQITKCKPTTGGKMPIAGSPKKLAQDIADGYLMLTPPMLKSYTHADLKTMVVNIGIVTRELRQEFIPADNIMAIKARNMKLSRLNQAELVIQVYCKKRRIPL